MCIPHSSPPPRANPNIDTKNVLGFFQNEIDTLTSHIVEDAKKALRVMDHVLHQVAPQIPCLEKLKNFVKEARLVSSEYPVAEAKKDLVAFTQSLIQKQ